MDAYLAFTLGAFCGLIVGFALGLFRPTVSKEQLENACEYSRLQGELKVRQESLEDIKRLAAAARRVA